MTHARFAFCLVGLGVLAAGIHCSSSDSSGFGGDGASSSSSGGSSGLLGSSGGTDGGGVARQCSGDLQSVLDENGRVVEKCAPDQGCAAGKCAAACDAAVASKGSLGCNYVVATPSFLPSILPPCFAVFMANGWGKAATITVSRGGQSFDATKFARIPVQGQPETAWPLLTSAGLPPGEVAVLFISGDPNSQNLTPLRCPVPSAVASASAVTGTGKGSAWTIATSVPVTAYDILPYGGASSYLPSAELLYPTTAWGKNYLGVLPPAGYRDNGPFWGQIVAAEDGTSIDILPNVDLPAGTGVAAAPRNAVTKYTLNAGEYIQFQGGGDMSGSVISSTKPVAFTGGNGYICYQSQTSTGGGCDSAHQQIPPVSAMGFDYIAAPFETRRSGNMPESIAYRIVGAVAGTTLTYDPPIPGAPPVLASGQVVNFEAASPFRVKSQDNAHPFYLGQMMAGCNVSNARTSGLGDEEYVNMVPPAQFLNKYVFFTDPSYGTTNLALTRVKTGGKFQDVTVKCLGTVTGWKPVGGSQDYEVATVDLVRNGTGLGTCKNGSQVAESAGPFGVVVWGTANYASYGYPAGGNVAPINAVVIPTVPR
jgi:hypothetical protein